MERKKDETKGKMRSRNEQIDVRKETRKWELIEQDRRLNSLISVELSANR